MDKAQYLFFKTPLVVIGMAAFHTAALAAPGDAISRTDLLWENHPGYRSAPVRVTPGPPGFTLLSGTATGILFTNLLTAEAESLNQNLPNGSGLALGDYDNDGQCDLFLCNLNGSSALFKNLGGWKFTNVTGQAGLANTNWLARAAVFADVDGDGNLDLLLTRSGKGARLYHNDGHGRFQESVQADLTGETGSHSATLADVDGDGALDLYVANYGENTIRSGMKIATRTVGGKEQVMGRMRNRLKIMSGLLMEYGEPGVLYHNDGRGKFTRVSWTEGTFRDETGASLTAMPWDLALDAVFRDINQDGFQDLYVCDDFHTPDRVWLNNGHGQFQAIAREAIRLSSQFSMAVDFGDLNHDGFDDYMVVEMLSRQHFRRMRQVETPTPTLEQTLEKTLDRPQVHRNTLYVSRGDGTYVEIANFAGVAATDWSWTVNFLDVDLDGWEDILIGNGSHFYDTLDLDHLEKTKGAPRSQKGLSGAMAETAPPVPNLAYRNRGNLTFEEVGKAWGFNALDLSQSIAFADLDNDGDLDIVVNCLNSNALVYRNNGGSPRLAVTLRGTPPNTRGIGARITVLGGAVPEQSQQIVSGGRYLAGDAPMRVFAAGQLTNELTLQVDWPSGKRSLIRGLRPNQIIEVDEQKAAPAPAGMAGALSRPPLPKTELASSNAASALRAPLFEEASTQLNYRTHAEPFDDFARQPLLPWKLSVPGPGVAWLDLDGDGLEDLAVGGSKGGQIAVFKNLGQGRFSPWPGGLPGVLPDDSSGLAAWPSAQQSSALLVGMDNYKTLQSNAVSQVQFAKGTLTMASLGLGNGSAPGPVALGDPEGTGTLEMFIGGRLLAGHYPEAASSQLLRNAGGRWVPDESGERLLTKIGLVRGAVFTDLDGNGKSELVLACDWGPVRILSCAAGTWSEVTSRWGLANLNGLWTGIAAGDFDGDGRMDLAVGNLGLNSAYQQMAPGPWFLYAGPLNGDQQTHLVEAYLDAELKQIVPWRQMALLEKTLPWLRAKFASHQAFSEATIDQILTGSLGPVRPVSANHLASTVFLNRGDHFEVKPLPAEAQWAPAYGVTAADFDGDGAEDLFLSQNNEAVRPDDAPLTGGRGLVLRGDGRGGFTSLSGAQSGVIIYGEQRGAAAADYDGDGRLDLVVAEPNGPLHLYRNKGGQPGLQVELIGPPGNPGGIGATIRLVSADRRGPAHEVHSGGGYWSQDSIRPVLATPAAPAMIEVRWPGGKITQTSVPGGSKRVQVHW